MTTPLTVYLPFNRDCLGPAFEPAKRGAMPPAMYTPPRATTASAWSPAAAP